MSQNLASISGIPELVIAFAAGLLLGMTVEHLIARSRRRAWRTKTGRRQNVVSPWSQATSHDRATTDAVAQLGTVMSADFMAKPLLNKGEARVFQELNEIVERRHSGWRVMAQVSMGEILRSDDAKAFACINSKRVDMLLVDEQCRPRHAIEYQGEGHYRGSAAARDAVKKEALRRAGIGYHEVVAGQTKPSELRLLVERLVPKSEPDALGQSQAL